MQNFSSSILRSCARNSHKFTINLQNNDMFSSVRSMSYFLQKPIFKRYDDSVMRCHDNYGFLYNNLGGSRKISAEFYNRYLSPESPPIGLAQNSLEYIHDTFGLPWWATIAITTFSLRSVITIPLGIYSMKIIAKVELLQPEIMKLSQRLKGEVAHAVKKLKWGKRIARFKYNTTMKKLIKELYIRDNCHPFKASFVMWFQIPLWISMSFALRNMSGYIPVKGVQAEILCPEMTYEGILWFTNLTLPDTTFLLPVSLGLLNLAITEISVLRKGTPSRFQKVVTNLLRGMSILMIPIGSVVPSNMCFYWMCSSMFGLAQNLIFKLPTVKRFCGVPITPSESDTPFQEMYAIARKKYSLKKNKSNMD